MVEIIEMDCPICDKGKISISEIHGYMSSRKGFVGRSVRVWNKGFIEVLSEECPECHANQKELEKMIK